MHRHKSGSVCVCGTSARRIHFHTVRTHLVRILYSKDNGLKIISKAFLKRIQSGRWRLRISKFYNFRREVTDFFLKNVVNSLSPFWKKVHVLPLSAICKWRAILENCLTWLWPEIAKLIKSKRPNRLKTSLTPTLLAKKHIYRIWIPGFPISDLCLRLNDFNGNFMKIKFDKKCASTSRKLI